MRVHPAKRRISDWRRGLSLVGSAAEDRADAGEQFAGIERFDHIVVRAEFKPDDPIRGAVQRGQENDRDRRGSPKAAAQAEAVFARGA